MQPDVANVGAGCELGPPGTQREPIRVGISWLRIDGGVIALLDGHVAAGQPVVRVVLESDAGVSVLPLARGYFVGELPVGGSAEMGELAQGEAAVIGYDRDGAEVARVDLNDLIASVRQ
jgi:hypothetical protein